MTLYIQTPSGSVKGCCIKEVTNVQNMTRAFQREEKESIAPDLLIVTDGGCDGKAQEMMGPSYHQSGIQKSTKPTSRDPPYHLSHTQPSLVRVKILWHATACGWIPNPSSDFQFVHTCLLHITASHALEPQWSEQKVCQRCIALCNPFN